MGGQKQQTAPARSFTTGILRYSRIQAITRRESVIRLQSFVKLRLAQSGPSTVAARAFNRWLDFFGYRMRATMRQDTRRGKSALLVTSFGMTNTAEAQTWVRRSSGLAAMDFITPGARQRGRFTRS